MTRTLMTLAFAAAMVAPQAQADVVINFDNFANGTAIDSSYAGVTFSNPLGGTSIYARNSGLLSVPSQVVSVYALPPGPAPYPAGTSPSGAFNASAGAVDVVFATPQGRV